MSVIRPTLAFSALLAAAGLSACAGAGQQAPTLNLPSLPSPSVGSIPQTTISQGGGDAGQPTPVAIDQSVGSATELYSRVASGAMSCWFAANGPLKKDFIFHATADAPSRGGKAEIVIHQRDPTQPNPRGAKAYLVEIEPTSEFSGYDQNRKSQDDRGLRRFDDGRCRALVERRPRMRGSLDGCRLGTGATGGGGARYKAQGQEGEAQGCPVKTRAAVNREFGKQSRGRRRPAGDQYRLLPTTSRDNPAGASRAAPEGRACRSTAARKGTRRRSAYSARRLPRY